MRVPDRCVADLRESGYLVFEGFLDADELAAAQEALWLHYPRPEEYFADPAAHAWLATDQWAGIVGGPWRSWSLNRLAFHPDLLDLAERFLGSADEMFSSLIVRFLGLVVCVSSFRYANIDNTTSWLEFSQLAVEH
jgi:hypothetical protein